MAIVSSVAMLQQEYDLPVLWCQIQAHLRFECAPHVYHQLHEPRPV